MYIVDHRNGVISVSLWTKLCMRFDWTRAFRNKQVVNNQTLLPILSPQPAD